MASQDQMKVLIEKIKKQPQWIFIAVVATLLLVRVLVFLNESTFTGDPEAKPTIITLKPELTLDSPEYRKVDSLLPDPPDERSPLEESFFKDLVQTDVFDPDQVKAAVGNRGAADRLVTDGYVALSKGDLEQAKRNAEEALALVANNRGALALQREIAGKLVEDGYAALESEEKNLDLAREKSEEALALVPGFAKALELHEAIAKASQPGGARNLMGSGPGVVPGMPLPGAVVPTTGTQEQE